MTLWFSNNQSLIIEVSIACQLSRFKCIEYNMYLNLNNEIVFIESKQLIWYAIRSQWNSINSFKTGSLHYKCWIFLLNMQRKSLSFARLSFGVLHFQCLELTFHRSFSLFFFSNFGFRYRKHSTNFNKQIPLAELICFDLWNV